MPQSWFTDKQPVAGVKRSSAPPPPPKKKPTQNTSRSPPPLRGGGGGAKGPEKPKHMFETYEL